MRYLVLTVLWLVVASGATFAQQGNRLSPECNAVVNRAKQAVDHARAGNRGAPEALVTLPDSEDPFPISLKNNFKNTSATALDGCFRHEGTFVHGQNTILNNRIHVYSLGEPQPADRIFVGRITTGVKKHIAIRLGRKEEGQRVRTAGVRDSERSLIEIDKHVVWLPVNPSTKTVEVLVCRIPCESEFEAPSEPEFEAPKPDSNPPQTAHTPSNDGGSPSVTEFNSGSGPAGPDTAQRGVSSQPDAAIPSATPETILTGKIDWEFVDPNGDHIAIESLKLKVMQNCAERLVIGAKSLRGLLEAVLDCVEFTPGTGYIIAPGSQPSISVDNGRIKITLKVATDKPKTVDLITILPKMTDGGSVTKDCLVDVRLVSNNKPEKIEIRRIQEANNRVVFSGRLYEPVDWQSASIEFDVDPRADCIPALKGPQTITNQNVAPEPSKTHGKLIFGLELDPRFGDTLIVLNSFVGQPQHNQEGTEHLYPIKANDDEAVDIFLSFVEAAILEFKNHTRNISILLAGSDGIYPTVPNVSFQPTGNISNAVSSIRADVFLIESDFKFRRIYDHINQEINNNNQYENIIFIGQSGLDNDTDYCQHPRWNWNSLRRDEIPKIFVIDFATQNNESNPRRNEIIPGTTNMYARQCPDNESHIVVIADSRRGGWRGAVDTIMSTVGDGLTK